MSGSTAAGRPDDLTPEEAAAEAARVAARVRRDARWPAGVLLASAVVNFAFFIGAGSGDGAVPQALMPVPILLGVAIFLIASSQHVRGRDAREINRPVVLAALGAAVLGLVIDQPVLPKGVTGWLVALALAMVVPYLVGAWRWLRA